MRKVLIVEDELLVRVGIAHSIPWEQMNLQMIGEVEDGLTAWELYQAHHPEIVITDIRIPGIDGFELIRRIRDDTPECEIVIVSNVESEELFRKAESYGIHEVLLKAAMKRNDIQKALNNCLKNCSLPVCEAETEYTPALPLQSTENNITYDPNAVLLIHYQGTEKISDTYQASLTDMFINRLNYRNRYETETPDGNSLIVFQRVSDMDELKNQIIGFCHYLAQNFHIGFTCIAVLQKVEKEKLHSLIRKATHLIADSGFFDQPVLYLTASCHPDSAALADLHKDLKRFGPFIRQDQYEKALSYLRDFPGELEDGSAAVMQRGMKILNELDCPFSTNGFDAMIVQFCRAVRKELQLDPSRFRPEIIRAIEYAENHLGEGITTNQAALLIGYHPDYFSRIFKNETGHTYSSFLNMIRIEHAKELLENTTLSIQEIAERSGFFEISYFGQKFKQKTGLSPRQWREEIKERTGDFKDG